MDELTALLEEMAERAEVEAGENLNLGRASLGYVGAATEFRFSALFARLLPSEKYNRLVEIIDEAGLSSEQSEWLLNAASAMRDDERSHNAARGI